MDEYRGLLLKDIKSHGTHIEKWNRIDVADSFILFWSHIYENPEETCGIQFKAIEWRSSDDEGDRYDTVLEGRGYFDGIRHLHFGEKLDDAEGYFNYPHLPKLIRLLQVIRELEKKYLKEEWIEKDLDENPDLLKESSGYENTTPPHQIPKDFYKTLKE